MYSFFEENKTFCITKRGNPLTTPQGLPVRTRFKALAEKLTEDLSKFGESPTDCQSIVAFHFAFLDFFLTTPRPALEQSILAGLDIDNDWTFNCPTATPEPMMRWFSVFGSHENSAREATSWVFSLTLEQLCATCVLGKAIKSVNIPYILAKKSSDKNLPKLIKAINEYYPYYGKAKLKRYYENFLFYFHLENGNKSLDCNKPIAAEKGNAIAQNSFCCTNDSGEKVPQDYKESIKRLLKIAKQGDAEAQYNLGVAYFYGEGVPEDYKKAVKWFLKAAEQGYANAQVLLGDSYFHGEGVSQDYKEALKWYLKAAEQGNARAQYSLGYAYANGKGVPQDYKEAVRWFRKSAEQGDANAQVLLGVAYSKGRGVSQDNAEAYFWFCLAASRVKKHTEACDEAAKLIIPSQIKEVQDRCNKWLEDFERGKV